MHTILADAKAAPARPAKGKGHSTANAIVGLEMTSFFAVRGFGGRRFHDCCFKSLVL
jgi:hypothetical protein